MSHRVRIADVAREAGVSTQTVSRVLNEKGEVSQATRQKVLEVIKQLGYRPSGIARGLVTDRTLTIGLVVPDISNPFFSEIARSAEDLVWGKGYTVILCSTMENQEREAAILQVLEDKRVDGLILCSGRLPDDRLLPLLKRHRTSVSVNRRLPDAIAATVLTDDAYGTMQAVHHLLAKQRRTIGFLAGPPTSRSGWERSRGLAAALESAGHPMDPTLSVPCLPYVEGGYHAARTLLSAHPEIDGLICYNDLVAVGALQACAELGRRVPDDVSVVGCDDIPLARLVTPPLTTLRVSRHEIASRAVSMLFDRMQSHDEQGTIILKPELIVRASAP